MPLRDFTRVYSRVKGLGVELTEAGLDLGGCMQGSPKDQRRC